MPGVFRDLDAELDTDALDPSTLALVGGRSTRPGAPLSEGPAFASAFRAGGAHGYARDGSPTWDAFEDALGLLEGGEAVAFASGMAAATAIVDGLAPDSRVVVAEDAYLEVRRLLSERAAIGLIELAAVDPTDTASVIAASAGADLVWLDALANPKLEAPELDLIAAATRRHGATLVVDSTLATPLLLRPLELGADLVIHSATKYIGGHSDLLLGAAVARDPLRAQALRRRRTMLGAVPGTMETWLALRGLRTLPLRLERGSESAGQLARRLTDHPAVLAVHYPGLPGARTHAAATRLLGGYGAVIAFELAGEAAAERVLRRVRLITPAASLGGVESLIERQGRWHAGAGIPAGLLRLSVGCEHPDDLWRDLSRALA